LILNKKADKNLENVLILFATHFKELEVLGNYFPKNRAFHLESVLDKNKRLQHTYRFEKGMTPLESYGRFEKIFYSNKSFIFEMLKLT